MRLSPVLWLLFAGAVGFVLGLIAATNRLDIRAKGWLGDRDALALKVQIQDAELALSDAEKLRLQSVIDSMKKQLPALPPERQPLAPATPVTGTTGDSLRYWHARADTAEAAYRTQLEDNRSLREYAANLTGQLKATAALLAIAEHSDSIHTMQRDSALAIASRAPVGRQGCKVLGVIRCPRIVVGYGATLAGTVQTGPSVTVGWTLLGD